MNRYPSRNLVYVAGVEIGVGHFLTSTSILKNYADRTNRKFHVICNKWVMCLDQQADIDPFYSMFFEEEVLKKNTFNISLKFATDTIESRYQNKELFLVVGNRKHGLTRLTKNLENMAFVDKASFMTITKFRPFIIDREDQPIDNIVVDTVTPFQSNSQSFDYYRNIPALAPLKCPPPAQGIDLGRCVGLHIRHGNGEYLHGRTEGSMPEFDSLVENIVSSAKKISEQYSLQMIAFSDNRTLLEHLEREHGIISLNGENISTRTWQEQLKASESPKHKRQIVASAIRDIYCLSQCSRVVCGTSLFTLAAYIHSPFKNFVKVTI